MTEDQRTGLTSDGGRPTTDADGVPSADEGDRAHFVARPGIANSNAWDPARLPADAAAAEEGVRLAFSAAGLPPPRVIWCRSPVEVAEEWSRAAADGRPGMNLKRVLFSRPFKTGLERVGRLAFGRARQSRFRSRVTGAAIAEAVLEAVGGKRPPLVSWICRARSHWRQTARPEFAAIGCGPDMLNGASLLAYLHEMSDGQTCDALHAMRLIAENAGWLVPYERFCWLSERPSLVKVDAQGRLHSTSGPALRYRDGWSRYFWKGVVVPPWVIACPRDITLGWIDGQVDAPTRHAMIDLYTAERFCADGGADPVQRDASATLWRRTWTHRGAVIDTWSAVEYAGGDWHSQRMFHPVPAGVRSPAEALSWLLGPQTTLRHHLPIGSSRNGP